MKQELEELYKVKPLTHTRFKNLLRDFLTFGWISDVHWAELIQYQCWAV